MKNFDDLKNLVLHTFRLYPKRSLSSIFLLTVLMIAEAISLISLIPIAEHLSPHPVGLPNKFSVFINLTLDYWKIEKNLVNYFAFFILIIMFKSLIQYVVKNLTLKIQMDYEIMLQSRSLDALIKASAPYLHSKRAGDMSNIINQETEKIGNGLFYIYNYTAVTARLLAIFLVLFSFSGWLFFTIFFSSILTIGPSLILNRAIYHASKREVSWRNQTANRLLEIFKNVFLIKSYNAEKWYMDKFRLELHGLKSANRKKRILAELTSVFFHPTAAIQIAFICYVAHLFLGLSFTELLVVLFTLQNGLPLLKQLISFKQVIISNLPSYQKVIKLLEDSERAHEELDQDAIKGFESHIRLNNLSFSYDKKLVLNSINLDIQKGQMLGLVGPSGAGKTTLLKILLRFLSPDHGSIEIDGMDISTINIRSWRDIIGFVPQEATLLRESFAQNIAIGKDHINESRLREIIEQSSLSECEEALQEREHTLIGEDQIDLSMGQKQRLSLARALYHDPEILILDEPTSALDSKTEAAIQKAFENLRGKKTFIIVAHRLSTIKTCDKIFVLKKGEIIESGSYNQLMSKKGHFFEYAKIQGMVH